MDHHQPSTRAIKRSKRINQYPRNPLRSLKMKETLRARPLSERIVFQINDQNLHAADSRRKRQQNQREKKARITRRDAYLGHRLYPWVFSAFSSCILRVAENVRFFLLCFAHKLLRGKRDLFMRQFRLTASWKKKTRANMSKNIKEKRGSA